MFNVAESLLGLSQYEANRDELDKAIIEYKAKVAKINAQNLMEELKPEDENQKTKTKTNRRIKK